MKKQPLTERQLVVRLRNEFIHEMRYDFQTNELFELMEIARHRNPNIIRRALSSAEYWMQKIKDGTAYQIGGRIHDEQPKRKYAKPQKPDRLDYLEWTVNQHVYDVITDDHNPDEIFTVVCQGDSMIDVGILPGATVYFKRTRSNAIGKIICCTVKEKQYIKRLLYKNGRACLHSENSRANYPDYLINESSNFRILGIQVKSLNDPVKD